MTEVALNITGRELAELVRPVIPFAGTDQFIPLLAAVKIESRGKYLTATATDRFRIGVSRIQPEVVPPAGVDFLIGTPELKRIQAIFKSTRDMSPALRLTLGGDALAGTVKVEQVGGFSGFSAATITFPLVSGDFPKVHHLFAQHAEQSTDPIKRVGLNAKYLASFQHAVRDASPAIVRSANYGKPIIVTIGDYFIGAQMPVRTDGEKEAATDADLNEWLELFAAQEPETAKPARKSRAKTGAAA